MEGFFEKQQRQNSEKERMTAEMNLFLWRLNSVCEHFILLAVGTHTFHKWMHSKSCIYLLLILIDINTVILCSILLSMV